MSDPLVTVIVPAWNAGSYIAETVESVLGQTHQRWELIVVDDGSTDDTAERLRPYRASLRYLRQENAGPGAARNTGLSAARGDYIAFLDADDLWLPEKLAVQLAVARRHPESGLIVCDGVEFDGETLLAPHLIGGPLGDRLASAPGGEITGRFYQDLVVQPLSASSSSALIPRFATERIGRQETRPLYARDWDYTLRLALQYPITVHSDALVRWRYRPSSLSGPQERRHFGWSLRRLPVLQRHLRLCRPDDRALVAATLRALVRDCAVGAYQYGRQRDLASARYVLARLAVETHGEPLVVARLIAAWLPDAVARTVARTVRSVLRRGRHS